MNEGSDSPVPTPLPTADQSPAVPRQSDVAHTLLRSVQSAADADTQATYLKEAQSRT